jgi:hypothetical protein
MGADKTIILCLLMEGGDRHMDMFYIIGITFRDSIRGGHLTNGSWIGMQGLPLG